MNTLSIVIPEKTVFEIDIPFIGTKHNRSPTKIERGSSVSSIYNETNDEEDRRCCSAPINSETILISRRIQNIEQFVPKRFFDGLCRTRALYRRTWDVFYKTIVSAVQDKLNNTLVSVELILVSFAAINCNIFEKYEKGLPLTLGDSSAMRQRLMEATSPEFIATLLRVIEYVHKIAEPSITVVEKRDDEKERVQDIEQIVQRKRKDSLSGSFRDTVLFDIEQPAIEKMSRGLKSLSSKEPLALKAIVTSKSPNALSYENVHAIFLITHAIFTKVSQQNDKTKSWDERLDKTLHELKASGSAAERRNSVSFIGAAYDAMFGTSSV